MSEQTIVQRRFTMLCPGCQRTDEVTTTIAVNSPDRYLAADVNLTCSHCKSEMFEVDLELLPQLRLLHLHNIVTKSHCAAIHDGKSKAPRMYSKDRYPSDRDAYKGPFIILDDIRGDCYIELLQVCREIERTIDKDLHSIFLTNQEKLTKIDIALMKPDQGLLPEALEILKRLINLWVTRLDERSICHPEDHCKLKNCKIPNYVANSNWDGVNPYEESTT